MRQEQNTSLTVLADVVETLSLVFQFFCNVGLAIFGLIQIIIAGVTAVVILIFTFAWVFLIIGLLMLVAG